MPWDIVHNSRLCTLLYSLYYIFKIVVYQAVYFYKNTHCGLPKWRSTYSTMYFGRYGVTLTITFIMRTHSNKTSNELEYY